MSANGRSPIRAQAQFGRHGVKFGLDIVHNYDLQNTLGYSGYSPNGTYNYTSVLAFAQDALSGVGGGCGTTAGGVYTPAGCYSFFHQTVGGSTFDLSTVDYGFFVQDDWKITPRLTINLGARYDYESIPGQQANLVVANFAPSANATSATRTTFRPASASPTIPSASAKPSSVAASASITAAFPTSTSSEPASPQVPPLAS